MPKKAQKALARLWTACRPPIKAKLLIGFYQIATKIGKLYQVMLPSDVRRVLEAFEVTISIGLDINTPFECFGAYR